MIICSNCQTKSSDSVKVCPGCQSNLVEWSTVAVALKELRANSRVKAIRVAAPADACPICHEIQGTYSKENVPNLPVEGCSHPEGCRAFYQPLLNEIYP